MPAPFVTIDQISSASKTEVVVISGSRSELSTSYPTDIEAALALPPFITMTGDGEREKAFRRAGLR
jgi:hypothetical protein